MKKIGIFLSFLIVLSLCGCKGKSVTPVVRGIECSAQIDFANQQYVCNMKIDPNGDFYLTAEQPDYLKDMKFSFVGGKKSAEYKGITYTPTSDNTPFLGVADLLYSALGTAENAVATENEDLFCIEGKTEEYAFTLTLSEAGLPLSLEIPGMYFKAEFLNMTIINATQ